MTPRPPRAHEATVLIADDQADVRAALRLLLKSEGIASIGADSAAATLESARTRELACALIDLNFQTAHRPDARPRSGRADAERRHGG